MTKPKKPKPQDETVLGERGGKLTTVHWRRPRNGSGLGHCTVHQRWCDIPDTGESVVDHGAVRRDEAERLAHTLGADFKVDR